MNIFIFTMIATLQTDVLSLDSACHYFNGSNNTMIVDANDSIMDYTSLKIISHDDSVKFGFPAYKFSMLLYVLKYTEDSLKTNEIKVLKDKKVSFLFKNKKMSSNELIKKILSKKGDLRDVYVLNCFKMLKTDYTHFTLRINNEEFVSSEASYLGVKNFSEFANVLKDRDSILKDLFDN